jgi:hypothetical protein
VVLVRITDPGFAVLQAAQHTHLDGVRALFLAHVDERDAEALARVWAAATEAAAH